MNTTIDYDASTRDGRDALRSEIRMAWDDGDVQASAMGPAFAVCEILHWICGEDVPAEAEFRPGAVEPSFEDYPDAMFVELLDAGQITSGDLAYWVRVLARYTRMIPESDRY